MNILVTGASGFVGNALTYRLLRLNQIVYTLHHKNIQESLLTKSSQFKPFKESITNTKFIKRLFKEIKFDYCFHLAAQALVQAGNQNPLETFETNIKGTWNILEAARLSEIKGLIIASTVQYNPVQPYETSKMCADMIAQTYAIHYHMPIVIARFGNIYGPGDTHNRIIPRTIKLLLKKKRPEIFTSQIARDYIYIDDVINAYIGLMQSIKNHKVYSNNIVVNFGCGKQYSNTYIVKKIMKIFGDNSEPIKKKVEGSKKIGEKHISITRAKKLIGWKPKYTLEKGLVQTVNWYKQYLLP